MGTRSYSEMSHLLTFEERFEYLRLRGRVGRETFGYDRYLNQRFYQSSEWRRARHQVIARDNGMDLGVDGYVIYDRIYIHHINPMTPEHIANGDPMILDPENLISVTYETHQAIHYGNEETLRKGRLIERTPGDTVLWRPIKDSHG